nr:glycoside hydrolase family 3 [uncultured bacterium]
MKTLDSLRLAPFSLDDSGVAWVEQTLAELDLDARLRQLFVVVLWGNDPERAIQLAASQPGGITRFIEPDPLMAAETTRAFASRCKVPPLVSGDLEGGCIGMPGGTGLPNQLGLAATGSAELVEQDVEVLAAEGRALGYNWTFTPVVDINAAFRSTIVATRSFGSNVDKILDYARINAQTFQRHGIAACAKHWPGEGHDDRDQHLVTTSNPLSEADWMASFGRLYRGMIEAGVMSVMSAHISWPAYARKHGVSGVEVGRPASVSSLLNQTLLRGELGFNGLIVSDATGMGGFGAWGRRDVMVPETIANGCDVLLFPESMEQDLGYLKAALADGRLSEARVDEAVTRVLGLKAALKLHEQSFDERCPPGTVAQAVLRRPAHLEVEKRLASASVTLVKDVQQTLPLKLTKHRRIVLITDPNRSGFLSPPSPLLLPGLLRERGFEVRDYQRDQPPTRDNADLVLYLLGQESFLGQTRIALDWTALHGEFPACMHRFWHELPCVLVSLGHPYYLYEAPRMPCVINAYTGLAPVQQAVLRKLLGEEAFTGVNPVDPACGLPDALF